MKALRSWLNDYIETNLTDDELASKLSMTGTSVESVEHGLSDGVVVAEIVKIEPHPQADRLRLATVNDGESELTVVCGAPNIEVGQLVPLAKLGTELPGGTIERVKIRGVESLGMLCAPDELGIGSDHDGIMILPNTYEIGKRLNEYLGNETVFDLEITPNRGDCLSHLGVAREIAAFSGKTIKKEPIKLDSSSQKATDAISVEVANKKLCPAYQARVIENVKIAESPDWLKKRLLALGSKPINNVVDITNYIMLDLGQPLHAFDLEKIGSRIIVRIATSGEKMTTLDGVARDLTDKDLVIANDKMPIALAGVMGGLDSEISSNTTSIVLEAAVFAPSSIRKTAKSHGLASESSYRFERGVDAGGLEYALNKAASMIAGLAGGRVLSGVVRDASPTEKTEIKIEYDKIINLLGLSIKYEDVNRYLKLLGFEISNGTATVPSWRHDISCWQDLAEEVGRIFGYEKVSAIEIQKSAKAPESSYYFYEHLKDILVDSGFSEVINYAFLSENDAKIAGLKTTELIEVANPIQPENKFLRNSLVPSLLRNVAKNPTFDSVALFEIANVFTKTTEIKKLGLVVSGKNTSKLLAETITALQKEIGLGKVEPRAISAEETARYKIRKPETLVLEVEVGELAKKYLGSNQPKLQISNKPVHYRPISKFPSLTRDLAFMLDKKIDADLLIEEIYSISDLINRVELFDEFASDKLGKNIKNVAYHLYLQKMDSTMTDDEANTIIKKVVKKIEQKFEAKLRTA